MSSEALAWASHLIVGGEFAASDPVSPVEKACLIVLAAHSDEESVTFVGQTRLSRITGFSIRSVREACKSLEARDYIRRVPRYRSDGSLCSHLTGLNLSKKTPLTPKGINTIPESMEPHYPEHAQHFMKRRKGKYSKAEGREAAAGGTAPVAGGGAPVAGHEYGVNKGLSIKTSPLPLTSEGTSDHFESFWSELPDSPHKKNKDQCRAIWIQRNFDQEADRAIAWLRWRKANDSSWQAMRGQYVMSPKKMLNDRRWFDDNWAPFPGEHGRPKE